MNGKLNLKQYFTGINLLKALFLFITYLLIKSRAWAGEDAFIFFKYVDNFVRGNGLVFNLGERVEGFTAPLWVFLLSLLRFTLGYELRPMTIILGFVLSLVALGYLLYFDNTEKFIFPLGIVLLISNSAFRDFATSGFETSLTYLLLIVFAVYFKKHFIEGKAFLLGLLLSLLVLNRPESFLLFAYVAVLYFVKNRAQLLKYISAFLITVVPYQIFRMGYYASLLPNTFYAKKGGEFYVTQGLNYFVDFIASYKLTTFILALLIVLFVINLVKPLVEDPHKTSRVHLLIMAALLLGYVLYSGGDYMHGRSLLMFFIILVVAVNDFAEKLFTKLIDRVKGADLEKPLVYASSLGGLIILLFILKTQVPVTAKLHKQINNINDERTHFGINFDPEYFSQYLKQPITGEFSWRDRAFYYRDISDKTNEAISVNMPNIGFFGYAGGDNVNVKGAVLIDPWMARQPIEKRGKIGHENQIDWPYILSRKPTFTYTPFPFWNGPAHAKFNNSQFSGVITDDSNDSYIPVFDLSNQEFLTKYKGITGVDVKNSIDAAQIKFLNEVSNRNASLYPMDLREYFSFLKVHWYPYVSAGTQNLYTQKRIEMFGTAKILGSYEKYEEEKAAQVNEMWQHVSGKLTFAGFFSNILYSLK